MKFQKKLNGWFDDAWNVWHLTKSKLGHIFTSSTKHARLLPRYNTTSLYTAYTDLNCYDYTKNSNRYRLLKRKYSYFLDTYRHHSPFPVYLSVLKSNGPRCYRQYPNSSCGIFLKSSQWNFKSQLYRFVRFWAIVGIVVILLAIIYKNLTTKKQINPSTFRPRKNSDRSTPSKQQTTRLTNNDFSRSTNTTTTQKPSSIHQQTITSNKNSTGPLNEQIEKQLRLWLEHEQNDGYRNLSETCRIAMNNTFLKQLVSDQENDLLFLVNLNLDVLYSFFSLPQTYQPIKLSNSTKLLFFCFVCLLLVNDVLTDSFFVRSERKKKERNFWSYT